MHRLSLWSLGPKLRVIPEIIGNLEPNVTGAVLFVPSSKDLLAPIVPLPL